MGRAPLRVKICGLTSLADAQAALRAGADLLGFNFYPPSPRYIDPQRCREIVEGLRQGRTSATLVGVFVNCPPAEVAATLDLCGLHLAQLSGDEPPADLERLQGRAFKALRPRDARHLSELLQSFSPRRDPPAWLVDAYHPALYGGTGQTGQWPLAAGLAAQAPMLLAGGLTPENVGVAVAQVQPWGVDVASGVESAPGKKDARKMATFVENAQEAAHQEEKTDHG